MKLVSIDEDEEAEKVNIMDLLQQNIQQNNNHQNDNELKENDHKNYNTTKNLGFFNHNPDPKKAICQKGLSKSKKIKLKSTKHTDVMGNKDSSDDQWTNKMVEYFSGRDDRGEVLALGGLGCVYICVCLCAFMCVCVYLCARGNIVEKEGPENNILIS